MASSTASLISSLAPDATGLDKIIGIPPGTKMYYDSIARNPRVAVGGYGLRENQRYNDQLSSFLDSLKGVNSQRMEISKQLLGNEADDSLRKLWAQIYGPSVDAGVLNATTPETRAKLGFNNDVAPSAFDISDQQAFNNRNAKTLEQAGTGLNQAREGGYDAPASAAGDALGLSGIGKVIPTRMGAAALGNSGGGAGGKNAPKFVHTSLDGLNSIQATFRSQKELDDYLAGRDGGSGAATGGAGGAGVNSDADIPSNIQGSQRNALATAIAKGTHSISKPVLDGAGNAHFKIGPKGQAPTKAVVMDVHGVTSVDTGTNGVADDGEE